MNIVISPSQPSDIPEMVELFQDAKAFKEVNGDLVWGRRNFNEDEVTEMLDSGSSFAGRIEKELVASLLLLDTDTRIWGDERGADDSALYVHKLVTSKKFRGQGLGARILDWSNDQAAARDKQFLRLDCEESNSALCDYYKKLGFEVVDKLVLPTYQPLLFQKLVT